MSLTLHCPVSGAAFKLPSFGPQEYVLTAVHPLLAAPISELAKIDCAATPQDCHILLCAWLEQLSRIKIAHWAGVLKASAFSQRWHQQEFEPLTTLIAWMVQNSNHVALENIPQLRLDSQLNAENVQLWRETTQSIISSYTTFFDIAETLRIKALREDTERLMNAPMTASCEASLPLAVRKLRSRKAYLQSSFMGVENQEASELVIKICLAPQNYEIPTIQKAKEFCLDHLVEAGIENYNDKQEVIHILDAALVAKIGMANMLGANSTDYSALQNAITANYTIERDGKTYVNSAVPKVAIAIQRSLAQAQFSSVPKDVEVRQYETEPKRDEYRSQLGFTIAHKQWQAQHSRRANDSKITIPV